MPNPPRTSGRRAALLAALALLALVRAVTAQPATELFFSEYVEGSSFNKALEIYNGTSGAIDLAAGGYNVQMFFNGAVTPLRTINLTGTVAAGDVYVLAQGSADAAILAVADQTDPNTSWFNGDDAVVLRKGTAVIDAIGQIGFDPGSEWGTGLFSTADNTLRHAVIVQEPTLLHQVDLFDGLGADGYLLINTARSFDELGLGDFAAGFRRRRLLTVPATDLAREHLGRPLPNAVLLGGFAALTGVVSIDSVVKAIRDRFPGKLGDGNIAGARAAFDYVRGELDRLAAASSEQERATTNA